MEIKNFNMKEETIVIFDNPSDYEKLLKLKKNQELKIIVTNYPSYEVLKKNQIPCVLSDIFLTYDERILIQKTAFNLSDWHDQQVVKKILMYKDVNLGSLIQAEFINILVNFLKNFYELYKITLAYKDANYFASNINYKILKLFSKKISVLSQDTTSVDFSPLDSLTFDFKIGTKNKNIELKLSKNTFSKLKSLSEKFSSYSVSGKKFEKKSKYALFTEINTLHYEELFLQINDPFVVFNRRQPSIWNKKTLNLIKNSGCIIENENSLISSDLKKTAKNSITSLNKIMESLFLNEQFFSMFFQIQNKSFWNIFSPYFIKFFKKRTRENIYEIQLAIRLFEKYNFSSVIINNEVGPNEKIVAQLSKARGIPIFLNQHGLIFDTEEAIQMNKYHGIIPQISDYSIVWGEVDYEYRKNIGVDKKRIFAVGSPVYDNFNNSIEPYHESDYVLLATSGPTKENIFDLSIQTIEKNIQTINTVCKILTKLNKKIIIKIHPSPDEFDPSEIINTINPEIKIIKSGNISTLIKNCNFVVVINFSSVILDCNLLNKPVILLKTKNYEYGTPSALKNNSCIIANVDDFEKTIHHLEDHKFYDKMTENGRKSASKYLVTTNNSSKKLYDLLSKLDFS